MVAPQHLVPHLHALRLAGRLDEAAELCRRILLLAPNHYAADRILSSLTGEPGDVEGTPGGLKPAPYAARRDFLPRPLRDALHARMLALAPRFTPAETTVRSPEGDVHTARHDDYRRALVIRDAFAELGPDLSTAFLAHLRAAFEAALPILRVPRFDPRFDEAYALAYTEGAFFTQHQDTTPGNTRRVTFVYQLQATPQPFAGGDLVLYDTYFYPGQPAAPDDAPDHASTGTRLTPEDNRLVLFPAEFHHEVTPVSGNGADLAHARLVLNGWLHTTPALGRPEVISATPY